MITSVTSHLRKLAFFLIFADYQRYLNQLETWWKTCQEKSKEDPDKTPAEIFIRNIQSSFQRVWSSLLDKDANKLTSDIEKITGNEVSALKGKLIEKKRTPGTPLQEHPFQ